MHIITHITLQDGEGRISGKEHLKAEMVARMVVDGDHSIDEVAEHYGLSLGEVHAAVAYYYDNQAELDAAYALALGEIRENAMTLEKFKAKLNAKYTQDKESD
jgi:uncharacterized protein (DUF433 family)